MIVAIILTVMAVVFCICVLIVISDGVVYFRSKRLEKELGLKLITRTITSRGIEEVYFDKKGNTRWFLDGEEYDPFPSLPKQHHY